MAIQQTKRQSDLEKRLQLLRHQVYGKDEKVSYQASRPLSNSENSIAQSPNSSIAETSSDLNYLHQDLLKILTLSSLAIGAQIILLLLLKNHVLNLTFFEGR